MVISQQNLSQNIKFHSTNSASTYIIGSATKYTNMIIIDNKNLSLFLIEGFEFEVEQLSSRSILLWYKSPTLYQDKKL